MGITGLLPFLDKASERIHIKSIANKTVAIDSYCWLHKGAFAVGDKLVRGEETDVHIMYCLKYVNMLLSHNIKPILVFDGRHLPAKAETEAKRRESRQAAKQRAIELMRKGNHQEARNHLRRCVDITHEMALRLIQSCRALNVDCIVAPYEADAQLAYLNKIGLADYIITEDSDLTLFGCRKILFKLDLNGGCTLVDADKIHLAMDCRIDKFSMDKFRLMCILSGCDYIDSLPGIGLAKACKFVMKTEETNVLRALDKIPAYLNMRNLTITDEYKVNVMKAIATFLHMVVFDPRHRKQVRLHEIDEVGTNIEYCCNAGEILDDEIALNLAVGNLNPFTMKKLDHWHPDHRNKKAHTTVVLKGLKIANHSSIWQRNYQWNVTNSTAPTQSTSTSTSKKTTIRQTKRSIDATNIFEQEDDISDDVPNDENLLSEYAQFNVPSKKRFKEDIEDYSDDDNDDDNKICEIEAEIKSTNQKTTPNRNPFKKEDKSADKLLSPTHITKGNNSLIKNQSPVKRIDFKKLEKLSRFNRTVVSSNQNVLSKFFSTAPKPTSDTSKSEEKSPETKLKVEKSETFEKTDIAIQVHYTESFDSAISNGEKCSQNSETAEENQQNENFDDPSTILKQFQYNYIRMNEQIEITKETRPNSSQSSSNQTDSDISEVPISISDESNDAQDVILVSDDKPNVITQSTSSKKTTNGSLKLGLTKKTTSKQVISSSVQSKLSSFGFKKKSQMQL